MKEDLGELVLVSPPRHALPSASLPAGGSVRRLIATRVALARRRGERRRWNVWRQAYRPRIWPAVIVAYLVAFLPLVAGAPFWVCAAISVLVMAGMQERLTRWRYEHPALSPEQLAEVQRRWAPYN